VASRGEKGQACEKRAENVKENGRLQPNANEKVGEGHGDGQR